MNGIERLVLSSALALASVGCGGAGGDFAGDPSDPALKDATAEAEGTVTQAVAAGDTVVASQAYWEKRTYIESMYLSANSLIDVSMTAESGGNRDPRLMILQYEPGAADPNLGCGVVASSQAKFKIVAQDDNSNGNWQPKLRFTVPISGCYTFIAYAQQPSPAAPMTTSVLQRKIWGPSHLVCNPFCAPTRELLSSTTQSIPVTGHVMHPAAFDYSFTQNPKNGADPWIFVFNYTSNTGASNDDTAWVNGGSVNSTIDIPGFSYDGSPYSGVLLTGYSTPNIPQDAAWSDAPTVEWWAYKRAQ